MKDAHQRTRVDVVARGLVFYALPDGRIQVLTSAVEQTHAR